MGRPSAMTESLASPCAVTTQHERLILELLPFKDVLQFKEWLQSPYVRGSWLEYCHDFLAHSPNAPECDKARTAQMAREATNSRNPRYLIYHPPKDSWTPEDHVVRFIVTVIADNMLRSLWSDSDWRKRAIDIAKAVYEVLSFLRATDAEGFYSPPGYDAALLN